jgi:outer membrane protein TolC
MTIPDKPLRKKTGRKAASALCMAMLASGVASASEKLSLDQAITLALKNNTSYRISIEKVRESRLKVRESWGALWPQVSTDVSYTRMGADSGMNSFIEGQYTVNIINGQIAINPGSLYHSLQSSHKGHVAAENDVRTAKAATIIQTIQLYSQMLLAGEMITLREDSTKALEENLRIVTTGYNRGTFSRLDFLRARVALSNEKTKLINARNDFLTLKAALKSTTLWKSTWPPLR